MFKKLWHWMTHYEPSAPPAPENTDERDMEHERKRRLWMRMLLEELEEMDAAQRLALKESKR